MMVFQETKVLLIQNNQKLTEEETEKQAAGQTRQETKEWREAKQLQHRHNEPAWLWELLKYKIEKGLRAV